MGKMKDLLNRIVLPVGLILQSRTHGGYIVVVKHRKIMAGVPLEYSCLSKDNGLITEYSLEELDDRWLATGYFDKTVTLLYGKL